MTTRALDRTGAVQVAVAVVALAAMFLHRTAGAVVDPDVWHQMALFRKALELGALPLRDHFAYTPTVNPSVQHEWGAGAIAYYVGRHLGAAGLVALRYALMAGLGVLCWRVARSRGASYPVLVPATLVALLLAGAGFSTVRAQMYSYVLLAALLLFLEADTRGERWWIAPWLALYAIWLNLHAGFLVGCGLFFLHWLESWLRGRPHRHLLVIGLAMFPMMLLTPYHVHYLAYLLHAVTLPRPHVGEWGPLWSSQSPPLVGAYLLSLALLAYAVRTVGWRGARGLTLVLLPAAYALASRRMVDLYAVVWLCSAPAWLTATPLGGHFARLWCRRARLQIAVWAAAALLFAIAAWPAHPFHLRVPSVRDPRLREHIVYPVGAVDYLARQGFEGNLFVGFDWGAYVMWKLHPAVRISMDSRYEVAYPPEVEEEQYAFHAAAPGWQDLLERGAYRSTDAVLLPRFLASRIHEKMAGLPGWKRIYRDATFEVFARAERALPAVDDPDATFEGSFP